MTKQELYRQIFDDMLDRNLLNEADACDVLSLRQEVEEVISKNLQDFVLVYKTGIIDD